MTAISQHPQHVMLYAPSGVVLRAAPVRQAVRRLTALGFRVSVDDAVLLKHQRFAGEDDVRLAAIHRVAQAAPDVALAVRGGYGLTRLLDRIDWPLLARSVERGTRWVGYSDLTALQMGLLAHTGAASWCGPMAADDFGRDELDEITPDCFREAMAGELEAIGFRTSVGWDGLNQKGKMWGGNLTMLCSLLGTPHWPVVRGGLLFLEDVNEHPYRVERCLLQLLQAGVLSEQRCVLVGHVSGWQKSPLDRGYDLKSMLAYVSQQAGVPVLTGVPFGHVPTKVTFPFGVDVELAVEGRQALLAWEH